MSARHARVVFPILTALAALLGALLVAAFVGLGSGCAGAAQRTVSALAVAAVAADSANATAYEVQARQQADDCRGADGTFEACWCPPMATPWQRSSRAECAIRAVADCATAGQAILDAGGKLDARWFAVGCAAAHAVEDAWGAAATPPAAVATIRAMLCGLASEATAPPPTCADPGPPPPYPVVTP